MSKKEDSVFQLIKLVLVCFFLVAVVLPLVQLLVHFGQVDMVKIFSKPIVPRAIGQSVLVSSCATIFSVGFALSAAFCMVRSKIAGKNIFHMFLLFPMLIPSLSHGTGLIILWGNNGIFTKLLNLGQGIYGFWGIVIGSIMYSFPVAYLMLLDVLRYEDAAPYEAASVLGIPNWRQIVVITLPYLRKPLINVFFAVFTMIVTDYGVPLMVGGTYKTLPVVMYEEVIGRQDFAQGSVFGVILLVPAVFAFFVDMSCRNRASSAFVKKPFILQKAMGRDVLSYVFLTIMAICASVPVLSFAVLTFANRYPRDMRFSLRHIQSSIQKGVFDYLLNSLEIALFVALIGTVLSFFCAYLTARAPSRSSRFLHLMAIVSLAIPGIVLGLSYVMSFKGSWIYGTLAILILVNTIHFFSSPYLMMYNSMSKINGNLEAVGATLGIGRLKMVKDIFIPQTCSTCLEMFSCFFINSMMTISAVAFLANSANKPLALMINQFEAQTLLEASAFVSLLIWGVNFAVKVLTSCIAQRSIRHKEKG